MSKLRTLEFSIAPVQSFVSQARRTRDYWAGSYLLSYLTACAMWGVSGGDPQSIRFPRIEEDPLWLAVSQFLSGGGVQEEGPLIASLPNRFTAVCSDAAVAGQAGEKALREAWEQIATGVWSSVRKLLVEKKVNLPELSSAELPPIWKKQVDNLWEIYWVDEGPETSATWGEGMNRRKNWRKSLFWDEQGEICTVCGQRVVAFGGGLSRQDVRRLWHEGENSIRKIINEYWKLGLEDEDRERLCSICLIKRIFPHIAKKVIGWGLKDQVHFPSTHDFAAQLGEDKQGEPINPYYAILLMDGDKLGQNLRDHIKQRNLISSAVAGFSRQVPQIVEKDCQGRVIYAGGDDVLAFLPLNKALSCAQQLRSCFIEQQKQLGLAEFDITISAAILMVHRMSPLRPILKTAHRLLDDVAKDSVGRDAFVLQVQKRSGPSLVFAKPWRMENASEESQNWLQEIVALSKDLFSAETGTFSNRFLYKMAALFKPFGDDSNLVIPFSDKEAVKLMTTEYLSNRDLKLPSQCIKQQMERLYKLGLWESKSETKSENEKFQNDVFEILHFLMTMEVKR